MTVITGRVLHPGQCDGKLLVLDDPLSFWGGFEPATGEIIDIHHPQRGQVVAGRVLAMPETRGSAGTPAGLAEAVRCGVGPLAVIVAKADLNLVVGVMVAQRLYQLNVPVFQLAANEYARLHTGQTLQALEDGRLRLGAVPEPDQID